MSEHVVPTRTYVLIFLGLIILTGLTTAVAFVDLGALNTVAALAIAVCKMLLVILVFMHVKYMPGLTKIVVVAGFFWLAILLALTLGDIFTRAWTPVPEGWPTSATFARQAGRSASDIVLHSTGMKISIPPASLRLSLRLLLSSCCVSRTHIGVRIAIQAAGGRGNLPREGDP